MDSETLQKIGFAAGGLLAGALGYRLLAGSPGPVYTGLSREYKSPDDSMAAAIWARPDEGYEIRFEGFRDGVVINRFPDFVSPVFSAPFVAAIYADDIAYDLSYVPIGVWAKNANEASEVRMKEKRRSKA